MWGWRGAGEAAHCGTLPALSLKTNTDVAHAVRDAAGMQDAPHTHRHRYRHTGMRLGIEEHA
jgi:hypothetical protein